VEFWNAKFDRNRERDEQAQRALEEAGWSILVVWECEAVNGEHLRNTLARFLDATGSSRDPHD
jgi:DNA mismatch endonuclease (patch repair protein)